MTQKQLRILKPECPAKSFYIRALTYSFLIFTTLGVYSQALAQQKTLNYQVYAGGVNALQAQLTFDHTETDYVVTLDAATQKFLAKLVPWSGQFRTEGDRLAVGLSPRIHQSISGNQQDVETKTFTYENNNVASLRIEENGEVEQVDIQPELTQNTDDILTATLKTLHKIGSGDTCNSNYDIFDGKRRFTIYFKDLGTTQLNANRYNSYTGAARVCTVEIEPNGGEWHDKPRGWLSIQEQGRQKGALPKVWMGYVDGLEHAVPVKIQVKTDYGVLFMHLANS